MTYDYKEIGLRIKQARIDAGFSLLFVAEKCNVQQYQTVSRWEKGTSFPSLDVLLKLCTLYDCELGYLLGEPGYENKTRQQTDIKKITGLSEKAVKSLCSMSPAERRLIDDLLSSERDLSSLALSYGELKRLNKEFREIPSVDAEWFEKTQSDLNYIRFTLSNGFGLFAEKSSTKEV